MIPYGRQDISEADIQAVIDVLKSDWLTQGPAIGRFEDAVAARVDAAYAVATCNATAALHVACLALGVRRGDLVWTVPNTFVASANCALYCGADVDFVDIEARSYNMSVDALTEKLKAASAIGRLPKVVIPVHFAGQSCDMRAIKVLADLYGIKIIEDASHAIGASHLGRPVGNSAYSDITVFSFHPVKIITTAEGGMALTNDPMLAERLRSFRSHGITRDGARMEGENQGPWYYEQRELGYNYRMTDMQAALGLSQLARLDEFCARRRALATRYGELLAGLPLDLPWQHPDGISAFHLYPVCLHDTRTRSEVFAKLRAAGIGVNVHYIPVHTQPYYLRLGFNIGDFPVAESYYARAISIPMYSAMTDAQQDHVVDLLGEACR